MSSTFKLWYKHSLLYMNAFTQQQFCLQYHIFGLVLGLVFALTMLYICTF